MNQTEEKTMFKNAGRVKRTIEEYFVLTVATLILVVGVYVFKFPNNFSFGGVTGIAVVLSAIMPTTPGNITFIINMALLVLGFIFLGKSFGIKTVYVSGVKFSGEMCPNVCATHLTAGAGTDLCDRASGGEFSHLI